MKIAECSHIRIRDGNDYAMNIERMVKHIEDRYQIDFRTLPRWEQLLQRMHLAITDCKEKIQGANRRKATIIDKLCIESCRPSPFDLTNHLVRTAKKWQIIDANRRMKKTIISFAETVQSCSQEQQTTYDEIPGEESRGHQNTEVIVSMEPAAGKEEATIVEETQKSTNLPVYVRSNQHKRITSLKSLGSFTSFHDSSPRVMHILDKFDEKPDEWLVLPQSKSIICTPKTIRIDNNSLEDQTISFSLLNCSSDYPYLNLRYKGITDNTNFKRSKIWPVTPVKLYPGITVNFKFIFKLTQNQENFESNLFFRVGQKVLAEAPVEGFLIPVVGAFIKKPSPLHITEEINIPPTYYWHLNAKCGFPSSKIIIKVPDDQSYDLHITKLNMNLTQDLETDVCSVQPESPSSESVNQRESDDQIIKQSETFVPSNQLLEDTESALSADSIALIINGVIQEALEVFVFEKTYLRLEPFSKNSIRVFQTKAEHIGFHQNIYELEFSNPTTGETVFRKTVKVFGNVLQNPIKIHPSLLDMAESPIIQGRCEDKFTITNSHKTFPVTVKINLAAKMRKLIRIKPMETLIPAQSSLDFLVGFCSKDLKQPYNEDLVHLTVKIIVIGDKSVYSNVPPIYFEILAPFSSEFMQLSRSMVLD